MIDKEQSEKYAGVIAQKKRAGSPIQTLRAKVRHKAVRLAGLAKPKIQKVKMEPAMKQFIIVILILALGAALYYLIF